MKYYLFDPKIMKIYELEEYETVDPKKLKYVRTKEGKIIRITKLVRIGTKEEITPFFVKHAMTILKFNIENLIDTESKIEEGFNKLENSTT